MKDSSLTSVQAFGHFVILGYHIHTTPAIFLYNSEINDQELTESID